MRRHAKAPSAGSTSGIGSSRGLFGRAFVARGAFSGGDGSGAPSGRLCTLLGLTLLLCALAMALTGAAQASKILYRSFGSAASGTLGGQFNQPREIAVNRTGAGAADAGDIYVVDDANHRIQHLDKRGNFLWAIGRDVIAAGKAGDLGDAFEKCTLAADCKAGIPGSTADSPAGEFDNPQGIAIDQDTGNFYVSDRDNRRIQQFDGDGDFVRMWGFDVIAGAGPPPNSNGTGFEVCDITNGNAIADCKNGVAGAGLGQLGAGSRPHGLAISQGTVFLANARNRRVETYNLDGSSPANFGSSVNFGEEHPSRIAVDSRGIVYAADGTNSGEIERYDSLDANGGGVGFLAPILAENSLPTTGPLLPGNNSAGGGAPFSGGTSGLAVDPDSDGPGPDKDVLHVLRDPATNFGPTLVQQFGPANAPGLASAPIKDDDRHGAEAGFGVVNGLGLNDSTGTLFVSDNHRIHVLTDPPDHPPVVKTTGTSPGIEPHLMTLEGTVNPAGFLLADCHFAYGLTTAYGESVPCEQGSVELGDGSDDIPVSAGTGPLEPNTTYHFRLFAANGGAGANGKDRTFTTGPALPDACSNAGIRAAQGIAALLLPDCMALEQVSPAKKANQPAKEPQQVSPAGRRVSFFTSAAIGDAPRRSVFRDPVIASRGDSGWASEGIAAPIVGEAGAERIEYSFKPDLSSWFEYDIEATEFVRRGLGGFSLPYSPPVVPNPQPENLQSSLIGASADHSRLYLAPANHRNGFFLPGDPQPSDGGAFPSFEDRNVYVAQLDSGGNPSMALLAREGLPPDGKVWGGNCGARLGGMEELTFSLLLSNGRDRKQGAISADGRRVYFSTRPGQPETGNCALANKTRIMERLETPTGPKIEELISSECNRVADPGPPAVPACAIHDGDDVYQGASVDQSLVYFTTNRQLADTDIDGSATPCSNTTAVAGCDLYVYDADKPAGQRLTQVSAGETTAATQGSGASVRNSITAISADGSHAYFVARTVLTTDENPEGQEAQPAKDNLYLYTHPDGDLSFVGVLASNDGGTSGGSLFGGEATWQNGAYPVPIMSTDPQGDEVGGDGHVLVFNSRAPLTAGDTDGASSDIFRYDAAAETLERITEAGPGGSDGGPFDVIMGNNRRVGTDYGENNRRVSEDGQTILFGTEERLLSGDVNEIADPYMWRKGKLYRLPGAAEPRGAAFISPVLSHDGSTVAYESAEQLLPSDGDSSMDVYVARVGGGFLPPAPPRGCVDEGTCQGPPTTVSGEIGAITDSFSGVGNSNGGNNCAAPAKQAQRLSLGAKRLRGRAGRVESPAASKRLRRRAQHSAKRAKRAANAAKRCRRANLRAGR